MEKRAPESKIPGVERAKCSSCTCNTRFERLWDHEAAGSKPVTRTRKPAEILQFQRVFYANCSGFAKTLFFDYRGAGFALRIRQTGIYSCNSSINFCIRSVTNSLFFKETNSLLLTHLYAMVSPSCKVIQSLLQFVTHKNST